MAISFGTSDGGVRVGIDYVPGGVTWDSAYVSFAVYYYTDNNKAFSNDVQTLKPGGADQGGNIDFTNNSGAGSGPQLRAARTVYYYYAPNEYGVVYTSLLLYVAIGGVLGGSNAEKRLTIGIPVRPHRAANPVIYQSASRISDTQIRSSWANQVDTPGPYDYIEVYKQYTGQGAYYLGNIGGGSTSWDDGGATPNRYWAYGFIPRNDAGGPGGAAWTNWVWTSPATPDPVTRTQVNPTTQRVDFTSQVGYNEHEHQLWHAQDGVWDASPLATLAAGVTTYTHSGLAPNPKHRYRVRAHCTADTSLYSTFAETTDSVGLTLPPGAPTNLTPNSVDIKVDPTQPATLRWTFNSTDTYDQTKYEVQYRESGTSTWTAVAPNVTSNKQHTLPISTFAYSKQLEWQVRTWGADAVASPWSATAFFGTSDPAPKRIPVYLNITSGQLEADSTGLGPGSTGQAYYYEQQITAQSHIVHTHNKNTRGLTVEFWDNNGKQRIGNVTKPDVNNVVLDFAYPMSGLIRVFGAV